MTELGVTVVVPTLNREDVLMDTLGDLLRQTHKPIEILVVDQSDSPAESLASLVSANREIITYHHVTFRGSAKARNYGWQNARYEAVVFVDDDIRCSATLVSEHMRSLQLSRVGLVGGGVDSTGGSADAGPPTGTFDRWTATPRPGFAARGCFDIDHVIECNFSMWREAAAAVGGIDEAFDVPAGLYEGTDFCLRIKNAGFRVYYNGQARLLHLAAPAGGNRVLDTKKYLYGLAHNRAILIRRHVRWFQVPSAVLRLVLLCASISAHYRTPSATAGGVKGFLRGWRTAAQKPQCGVYQ